MAFESIANEMRDDAERMRRRARDVFSSYLQLNRRAYGVMLQSTQSLAKAELDNARHFYDDAFDQFNQARVGGLGEMMMMPVRLVPAGRRTLGQSLNNARAQLFNSRDEMQDVLKQGYREMWGTLSQARDDARVSMAKGPRKVAEAASQGAEKFKQSADDIVRSADPDRQSSGPAKSSARTATTNKRKTPTAGKRAASAPASGSKTASKTTTPNPAATKTATASKKASAKTNRASGSSTAGKSSPADKPSQQQGGSGDKV